MLQFYAQNELISNMIPATGLKIVGTGACFEEMDWICFSESFDDALLMMRFAKPLQFDVQENCF